MELTLAQVSKTFEQNAAVDAVSYTMRNGVYGLLGVNGAGKTTLMRMICTLMKPTSGVITWNGRDIWKLDAEYRRVLGYLPQEFGFYPDFTAEEYLLYIASIKGLRPAAARQRVDELLHTVGMERVRKKKMKKFSGGMKRRVGIAQAMLNDPEILVLDEPTVGLDPNERIRFRNLISELSSRRLVLLSTHIVSDVESIANDILLMKDGRIVRSGTPRQLVAGMPVRVWRCRVPKQEEAAYAKRYRISNIKMTAAGTELRILSEQPPCAQAVQEDVTLEDVFLYHFGETGGERNAVL